LICSATTTFSDGNPAPQPVIAQAPLTVGTGEPLALSTPSASVLSERPQASHRAKPPIFSSDFTAFTAANPLQAPFLMSV
jgi:hypothetical protein